MAAAAGLSAGLLARAEKPQVAEAADGDPIRAGQTNNTASSSTALTKSTSGGYGFYSYSPSSTYGLIGVGGTYGVYASGSYGVYASGTSYGVYASGTSYGVYAAGGSFGVYVPAGGSYGIYAQRARSIGVFGNGDAYGVYGYSTSGYGVVGGTGGRWAGVFFGDLYVSGRIVLGSGRVVSDQATSQATESQDPGGQGDRSSTRVPASDLPKKPADLPARDETPPAPAAPPRP